METKPELVARATAGDRIALATLIRRSLCYVQRASRRFAETEEDAEEIAQDALCTALRTLAQFENRAAFDTWLFALVRSAANRKYRRCRPVAMSSLDFVPDPLDDTFEGGASARHDVIVALASLSEIDRALVLERDVEGRSYVELAQRAHLTVGAVKSRLHRARGCMRDNLIGAVAA